MSTPTLARRWHGSECIVLGGVNMDLKAEAAGEWPTGNSMAVMSGTLEENVVMGRPWEEKRYAKVIAQSCMESDLRLLPCGERR